MNCASCGCSPCSCASPSFLNQPRLFDPVVSGGDFQGGTFEGPTINGGTSNGQQINGATIDCTTLGCTQPGGTCDGTLATTAFVCGAIIDAISAANPAFCTAVNTCLGLVGTFCDGVEVCINNTPGIIANPAAFDPAVYATDTIYGVTRFATLPEVQAANCELAIDPCTLGAFWSAGGPNALWTAFEAAVTAVVMGGAIDYCAATAACGYAPLADPVFTGDPQAPTPAPGDNDTSIATTAFVTDAVATAISALNPAFCAAVAGCGGGGGGGGNGAGIYAEMTFDLTITENGGISASLMTVYSNGMNCTQVPLQLVGTWPGVINFTFSVALPDDNYEVSWSEDQTNPIPASGTQFTAPKPLFANQAGAGFDWTIDPTVFTCGGAPCTQTRRIHVSVLTAVGAIPCAVIQATFPAAGANLAAGTRLLGDDCASYTAQEVFNQLGLAGVAFATAAGVGNGAAPTFARNCALLWQAGPQTYAVTFSVLQPDTNYSVVFGGGSPIGNIPNIATTKTTAGFTLDVLDGSGVRNFDFACIR